MPTTYQIASVGLLAVLAGPQPAPIERLLAGYTIEKTVPIAIRDARTSAYLIRTND